MSKIILIFLPVLLLALSPFDSKVNNFDLSAYETTKRIENIEASQNEKLKCRWICDKKVYKEQKISEAIEFYKKDKSYFRESK
ncbi:hypothetical protein [Sulfurimonas sp.]|uniref:hypothetical protein n=1 Tax=Sulfurimonas sp. TaxID=2022749 RepID=UPI0025D04199|nr:hypothetical protein [Sulfurimonas sp.]